MLPRANGGGVRVPVPGSSARLSLDDLPVRILPDDLPVPELEVITATDLHPRTVWSRAGERPFGHALRPAHPVSVLPVVDVWKAGKTAGERITNI